MLNSLWQEVKDPGYNYNLNPDTTSIQQDILLYWINVTSLGFISTKAVLQETASSPYLTYNSEPACKRFRNIQMWGKRGC